MIAFLHYLRVVALIIIEQSRIRLVVSQVLNVVHRYVTLLVEVELSTAESRRDCIEVAWLRREGGSTWAW